MNVQITRHALDRVPLSLLIDDSTLLVNLSYFWMRDRNAVDGENRRWEDVPVVIPESFTRTFAEWCLAHGVRGKYSVVPCPAGLGRVDEQIPLFTGSQHESWLKMCRETIMPAFDITPEMLTHSVVVDPKTLKPLPSGIWEQYEWVSLPDDEDGPIIEYIATACRILDQAGLPPTGVTSPGYFGGQTLSFYTHCLGQAVRSVSGTPTPFFFTRSADRGRVESPVWHKDKKQGMAVGEMITCAGDWTGNWTGYGEVSADRYITDDLQGGRLPEVIDAGDPALLCSHWQGFYGLHNEDQRGFKTLQTVVERLKARDPNGEWTQWRKCSEIAGYTCCREMAEIKVEKNTIELDLPVLSSELTLRVTGADVKEVKVDGKPLRVAKTRRVFISGTFIRFADETLVAFDPKARKVRIEVA